MYFDATPTNMTEVLVAVLALVAIVMLMRKQYDSNMPLLFYFAAVVFTNMADRPVDPYLLYGSLGFALLLRFEFLNKTFSKLIAFCTTVGLALMVYTMISDVLV
jgi:hypothetical protein